jgi:hypothetical protein
MYWRSVSFFSSTRTFPLEGKDGLALWGQADVEKCVLNVQAGKEFCLRGDKAQKCVWIWDHCV